MNVLVTDYLVSHILDKVVCEPRADLPRTPSTLTGFQPRVARTTRRYPMRMTTTVVICVGD